MPIISIRSIDDPRIAAYRDLNSRNLTRLSQRFVVEGQTLVRRLLNSSFPVDSVLSGRQHVDALWDVVPADVPLYIVPDSLVSAIVGFRFHRGTLACGRRRPSTRLTQMLANLPERATLVVCPRILDPTNLGSIVRSSCALGVAALLLGPGCADPYSRRVIRVSMGTALQLPILEITDLPGTLRSLRQSTGFQIIGAVLDEHAEPLATAERSDRLALVFGSEGHGLDWQWLELCDRRVTLPMLRGTDSLNVATAAAVFLYHFTSVAVFC